MRVLLVTTDPRVAVQVRTALVGEPGLDITEVRTPQRALAMLDEGRSYDVIVADNDTAPTGGLYLARHLRGRELTGADVPPLLLLLARLDDRFLARWAQVDAYLIKPIDPFDLSAVLHALVAGEAVPDLPSVGAPRAAAAAAGGEVGAPGPHGQDRTA